MSESAEKEPTMEEILSSIRRIISEEDDEPAPAKARAPEPADYEDDDSDVLDLTDQAEPEPARTPIGAVQAAPLDEDDILVLDRDDEIEPAPAPVPVAARAPAPEPRMADIAPPQDTPAAALSRIGEREAERNVSSGTNVDWDNREGAMSDRLVSDNAASAAAGAFARLQRTTRVPETNDDKSLEAIVRELLKPMLKDWLDQNLPSIVEKKVREEVERIARQA